MQVAADLFSFKISNWRAIDIALRCVKNILKMAIGRIIIFKPAQTATTDVKSLVNNLNDILEAFADFLE